MKLAYMAGVNDAKINGISALSIRDVGHTGRHGAFADFAAEKGYYQFALGGNRQTWSKLRHMEDKGITSNQSLVYRSTEETWSCCFRFCNIQNCGGWIYAAQSANALQRLYNR